MKSRSLIVAVTISLYATKAFAQKGEIFGNYTFMQFNPTINGLNSRSLNGGGGGAQWNIVPAFGIKAEFQGYMSTETTVNVTAPIPGPNGGIIPVGTYKSNATMFTYLFGPVVQLPGKRVRPFAEVLFGGMQTELYTQLNSAVIANGGKIDASETQHPFTMAVGGGLDININRHVALRIAQADWVLTRYTNPWTNTNNQNSFRYLAGLVIKFGGEKPAPPLPPPPPTKTCAGGITVPASQDCPKRNITLGLNADKTDVCVGTAVTVSPGANLPNEASLQWSVNGTQASQGRTFDFQTGTLAPGTYRIGAKATGEGYNDASAETSVTVRGYQPPTGTVTVTPGEIAAGDKARVNSSFQPGQCGGTLQPAQLQVSEGSILGNTYDSASLAFDPSTTSEQQKTIAITATASDGKSEAVAKTSLVVRKKGATVARRLPDVVFPLGSSRVNNCGKRVLLEELKALTSNDPSGTVVFVGHQTDKEAKSAGLDEKRALNAAAVISAGQGVCTNFPANRIQVSSAGTTQGGVAPDPHFCGTSAGPEKAGQNVSEKDDQAKYRRVEVWFVPTGGIFPASVGSHKDASTLSVSALGCPK